MENKILVDVPELTRTTLGLLVNAIKVLRIDAKVNPNLLLKPVTEQLGNKYKKLLGVDLMAQANFNRDITLAFKYLNPKIVIHGEESFDNDQLDLNECETGQIFGIVDMVDGTDLLERNLSNWCSAVCFFEPKAEAGRRIVATFVGMPDGEVFFSTRDDNGVLVYKNTQYDENFERVNEEDLNENYVRETLPFLSLIEEQNLRTKLKDASVCYYGQKAASLLSLIPKHYDTELDNKIFRLEIDKHSDKPKNLLEYIYDIEIQEKNRLRKKRDNGELLTSQDLPIDFRIYTLNGIPTVIRLIDYRIKENRKIDVVFNLTGQSPHDAVAGLYQAIKVGAIVRNLETQKDMTIEELENKLMKPAKSKLKYMVASNRKLAEETEPLLLPLISN